MRMMISILLISLLLLSSCSLKTTSVQSILDNPEQYVGKTVTVSGSISYSPQGICGDGHYTITDSKGYYMYFKPIKDRQYPESSYTFTGIIKESTLVLWRRDCLVLVES